MKHPHDERTDAAAVRLSATRRCSRWGRTHALAQAADRGRADRDRATGKTVLRIAPEALSELAFQAFHDVSHLLRPAHLAQLRAILDDPEA